MELGEYMNEYLKKVLIVTKEDDYTYSQKQKDDVKKDFSKLVDKIVVLTSKETLHKELVEALRKRLLDKVKAS